MICSDWWIFGATLGAGILTALATIAAVVWTNKKTEANYKREFERQRRDSAMVIIKPSIKTSSIWGIFDRLLFFNEWNRVLMLSNPNDGFEFYDNEEMNTRVNKFFSIKNESKNEIHSIKIDVSSVLTTDSGVVVSDGEYSNFVKLLRNNEEIMFRIYTTKQRDKLWEEINKNINSRLLFKCTVNYLTSANRQICYEYEIEIYNISVLRKFNDGEELTCDSSRVEIKKDEFTQLDEVTLNSADTASYFRNLQDRLEGLDRINYIQRKVGAAQAEGLMSVGYGLFSQLSNSFNDAAPTTTQQATENSIKEDMNP